MSSATADIVSMGESAIQFSRSGILLFILPRLGTNTEQTKPAPLSPDDHGMVISDHAYRQAAYLSFPTPEVTAEYLPR